MEVTTSQIREWMDKQIEAVSLQSLRVVINDKEDYINNLSHTSDDIHLTGEAVRYIAEKLDLHIWVRSRGECADPYEISILYRGHMFFGIESEAEYQERGAIV